MSISSRHLEVIYCDDIREEVGSKLSYMGVYAGELNVAGGPQLIAKLCIVIRAVTAAGDPFQSLDIRVAQDGIDAPLMATGPIVLPEVAALPVDGAASTMAHIVLMLSPYQIEKNTVLRVSAVTEREELYGMPLRIRIQPAS